MKRFFTTAMFAAALLVAVPAPSAYAQLGNLVNKAKQVGSKVVKDAASKMTENGNPVSSLVKVSGDCLYVSATTGSARADGKSPSTAVKDLQKAIDLAKDGDVILVAEGNYLGNMDRGYIENGAFGNGTDNGKFISIIGGYSTDFSECNPVVHITKIQPAGEATAIKHCLMNFTARHPYGYTGPKYDMVISGLVFDLGELNRYCKANVDDDRTGTPNKGVLTGRFVEPGASPGVPMVGGYSQDTYALHIKVEDNLTITNCVFVNASMMGLEGQMGKGKVEICNNVFVANRYAGCDIQGSTNDAGVPECSLEFHHNTVLFTWCRTKVMEDMGQGFRFRNRIRNIDVHHNIFGTSNRCGVERTFYEANKEMEKAKVSNLYDNLFFANNWDLEIANGASKGIGVPAARIEEAEEIGPKYEGNKEMPVNDQFVAAIDKSYLEGFMSLNIIKSSTYDPNSAANQGNRLFGANQQGTEIVRPNMYCNKYPWEKTLDLFGAYAGYGAQTPTKVR